MVAGTPGDDSIGVLDFGSQLLVQVNNFPAQFIPLAGVTGILVQGGAGNDTLAVSSVIPATLRGGAGGDSLSTQSDNDVLLGGAGNDRIDCQGTGDTAGGGTGNDTLTCNSNGDLLSGDDGDDSLSSVGDRNTLRGAAGNDTVSSVGATNVLLGGGGADSLEATDDGSTLRGGGGEDTLNSVGSNDLLLGGAGNDFVSDVATGDTVDGGAGNDLVQCVGAGCSLLGGDGNDVFVDYGAGDSIDGGTGLNVAASDLSDNLANIFEVFDPAPPSSFTARPAQTSPPAPARHSPSPAGPKDLAGVVASVVGGVLKITGTAGNDSIAVGVDGLGDVTVAAGGSSQTFPLPGIGGVVVSGGAGDDTIRVDPLALLPTTLRGGAGNDSIVGGGGSSVLVGGAGNDTLQGGSDANLLVPGARLAFTGTPTGNDVLIGGPAGSTNLADFSHRTDNLFLSNDGRPDSGDAALGERTTIMPSVQAILSGTADDTVVGTTPGGLLTAGVGHDSLVSGGDNTVLVAGPNGADTVASVGLHDARCCCGT